VRRNRPGDDRQGRMGLNEAQGIPNLICFAYVDPSLLIDAVLASTAVSSLP